MIFDIYQFIFLKVLAVRFNIKLYYHHKRLQFRLKRK